MQCEAFSLCVMVSGCLIVAPLPMRIEMHQSMLWMSAYRRRTVGPPQLWRCPGPAGWGEPPPPQNPLLHRTSSTPPPLSPLHCWRESACSAQHQLCSVNNHGRINTRQTMSSRHTALNTTWTRLLLPLHGCSVSAEMSSACTFPRDNQTNGGVSASL